MNAAHHSPAHRFGVSELFVASLPPRPTPQAPPSPFRRSEEGSACKVNTRPPPAHACYHTRPIRKRRPTGNRRVPSQAQVGLPRFSNSAAAAFQNVTVPVSLQLPQQRPFSKHQAPRLCISHELAALNPPTTRRHTRKQPCKLVPPPMNTLMPGHGHDAIPHLLPPPKGATNPPASVYALQEPRGELSLQSRRGKRDSWRCLA